MSKWVTLQWKWKVKVKSLSRVRLFVIPWTVAYQAPPSIGFSRQEYWSGLPCLLQGIFPTQRLNLSGERQRSSLYTLRRCIYFNLKRCQRRDFAGRPVVKTFLSNEGIAGSVPGWKIRSHMPLNQKKKKKKEKKKQYCNKFNKDFKNGPHQQKSSKKKKV